MRWRRTRTRSNMRENRRRKRIRRRTKRTRRRRRRRRKEKRRRRKRKRTIKAITTRSWHHIYTIDVRTFLFLYMYIPSTPSASDYTWIHKRRQLPAATSQSTSLTWLSANHQHKVLDWHEKRTTWRLASERIQRLPQRFCFEFQATLLPVEP